MANQVLAVMDSMRAPMAQGDLSTGRLAVISLGEGGS